MIACCGACDLGTDEAQPIVVPIMTLATSRDGKTLVIGGPAHAPWLVSISDRKLLDQKLDADDWVKSAAIAPDGAWLAGGANGGEVYLWKMSK